MADLENDDLVELIERAQTGNHEAWERLWDHCSARLFIALARQIPPNMQSVVDAEDVRQETYLTAWEYIAQFEWQGDASFDRWLFTIGRHVLTDIIRAHKAAKRGGGHTTIAEALLEIIESESDTPSRGARRQERKEILLTAIAELRENYKEALDLRYLKGESVESVASKMDCSKGAVQMMCSRAFDKLRVALGSPSEFLSE